MQVVEELSSGTAEGVAVTVDMDESEYHNDHNIR